MTPQPSVAPSPLERPVAVSNISWSGQPIERFFDVVAEAGARGVELATSLIWPEPVTTTAAGRAELRRKVEARGLSIVGLHALLFARKDLQLLSDGAGREQMCDYLKRTIDVCADLGGRSLVLGGPKSRRRGDLSTHDANRRGASILHEVGDHAAARGCVIALEALPAPACDFVTNLTECAEMVRLADTSGVQLHFDTGAADITETETSETILLQFIGEACHCHINDFDIMPPGFKTPASHPLWARRLRAANYQGWVSIEMKCPDGHQPDEIVRSAVRFVRSHYTMSGDLA